MIFSVTDMDLTFVMKLNEKVNTVLSFIHFICSSEDIFSLSGVDFTYKDSKKSCYFSFSLSRYTI